MLKGEKKRSGQERCWKREWGQNWIVDSGSLSPPSFPPSFIYLMWNHASLLSLVSASITVSCLHRAAWGVRRAPHSASTGDRIWTDRTGLDGTGLPRTGVWICVCACVCICDGWQRAACVSPQRVIACSSTGLASRVAYLEGTVLKLCPSLHLNALIRSVCLWDLCMESLTALLFGVREIRPLVHRMHWTLFTEYVALNQSSVERSCCLSGGTSC